MNNYTIKLEREKQQFFGLIYSLRFIELEILIIFIETNLINGFIWPFKFSARVFILFNWKPNKNFYFYRKY